MKKTRLEIIQECENALEHIRHFQKQYDEGHRVTLEIGKKFYQNVISVLEEEQAKKPLTLIYLKNVSRESDIERLTEYYEQRFGSKVIVLSNNVQNVIQIDPESNIGTMYKNATKVEI